MALQRGFAPPAVEQSQQRLLEAEPEPEPPAHQPRPLNSAALAQDGESFSETIEDLEHRDGFIPLYVDEGDGRILAELSRADDGSYGRMIYTSRMTSGLGSNPVGIDRGLGGSSEVLRC